MVLFLTIVERNYANLFMHFCGVCANLGFDFSHRKHRYWTDSVAIGFCGPSGRLASAGVFANNSLLIAKQM